MNDKFTLYDSDGRTIRPSGGTGERNEQINGFFRDNLRLYLPSNGRGLICYFPAKESTASRRNHYFVRFQPRSPSRILEEFADEFEDVVEEYGLILDQAGETEVLDAVLDAGSGRQRQIPGDSQQHTAIERLLDRGERLEFSSNAAGGVA
ncbi:MAG: hypothetical protein V5A46_10905, partial [Haloferacaceae archaeon]